MADIIKWTGKINSELTEKPPFRYFRRNRYKFVMYDYNRNVILIEAMKNREG